MSSASTTSRITVRNLTVTVKRGGVKHLHLSVHPPHGAVRVSAPEGTSDHVVRRLVVERLSWVRRQRAAQRAVSRPPRPEYTDGETLHVWGRAYRLRREYVSAGPHTVELRGEQAILRIRHNTDRAGRQRTVERYYREQIGRALRPMASRWEQRTGLRATAYRVKKMRTKWGSCNVDKKIVWLNLELARHPTAALSYVILHELLHLRERGHTAQFRALLEEYLPGWAGVRERMQGGLIPPPSLP